MSSYKLKLIFLYQLDKGVFHNYPRILFQRKKFLDFNVQPFKSFKLSQYQLFRLTFLLLEQCQQNFLLIDSVTQREYIEVEIKLIQQNENKLVKQNKNYQFIWKKIFQKNQQLDDFLVSQYFYKQISKINEDEWLFDQMRISKLREIRDKSKIGKFDFSIQKSLGVLNFLRDKLIFNEVQYIKLITLIQASAELNNFEQESGNAFIVLSHIEAMIKNINFNKMKIKNSSMNKMQFFRCTFNHSIIDNVSISLAQFIQCEINYAKWNNIDNFISTHGIHGDKNL